MPSDRQRILELALETLQSKKKQIDIEIAEMTRELRGVSARKPASSGQKPVKRAARFSREERLRRSERMKAYWDNWRKKKTRPK
jgi:hypothetical protein